MENKFRMDVLSFTVSILENKMMVPLFLPPDPNIGSINEYCPSAHSS